jgi:molybdopterin/thiamine biosynthesis adenylyltransferase
MTALADIRVVVVGLGGLGCPALLGLIAAGCRRFTLIDPDKVESSNLQRQVLFGTADVGMPKTLAATMRVRTLDRRAEVEAWATHIRPRDVHSTVEKVRDSSSPAIIVECTDDPALKFAFNDACIALDVPLVIGSALGLQAQAVAIVRGSACYRCIYENPPAAEDLPSCETAGVLGPTVGLAGSIMVALAIELAQRNHRVAGQLWAIDTRCHDVRRLRPKQRPDCPACFGARADSPADSRQQRSPRPNA